MTADFESIATIAVGSGGSANVEFTSIPGTYTHLQLRIIAQTTTSGSDWEVLRMQFNGDTGSNYALHQVLGTGSSVAAGNGINQTFTYGVYSTKSGTPNSFSPAIMDILDYKDTNKFKTVRTLTGPDLNGSGELSFQSGLWRSTSAITSIKIYPVANNIAQYSHFALYGIGSA